jgi:hypothetical protein
MNPAAGPELRDIHLPPPPGWWPPAPGWWIAAAIILAAVIYISIKVYISVKRRRVRRAIFGELDRCIADSCGDSVALAASLSLFLRRLTLRSAPEAAAYSGERWVAYLDRQGGTDDFSRGIGRALLDAPFRPRQQYDSAALTALVRRHARNVLDKGAAHA